MSQPTLTGHLYLRNHRVLVVDDETLNLEVFRFNFASDFALRTAHDAQEALAILGVEEIAVVVADHRMPGMTGLDLLTWLAEHRPATVRILLTAHSEPDLLLDAVNRGVLFRYIPKPWDPDAMRQDLLLAIQRHVMEQDGARAWRDAEARARVEGARVVASALQSEWAPLVDELASHPGAGAEPARRIAAGLAALRERGRLRPNLATATDLDEVATRALAASRYALEAAGVLVERHPVDTALPVQVDVDQAALAVAALLVNAAAAAGSGGNPRVELRLDVDESGARATVRDHGPGPGPDPGEHFLPFQSTRSGAPGLGLAMVRAIAEAHGGRCGLDPAQPGSRAWISFPLRQ
jgi:CheY-like chemotaxis protein